MNKLAIISVVAFVAAACGGATLEGDHTPTADPSATHTSNPTAAATATSTGAGGCSPGNFETAWPDTDFTKCTVDIGAEIIRGCPGRDCIPALDAEGAVEIPAARGGQAVFVPVSDVDYAAAFPVAYVSIEGEVRGYPLHILTWHEIVNDVVGDVPVVATFCPLCNTAIAYDRQVGGRVLDFGVSGNLRNSDLVMWDRQTESWWQQATGEGIVGTYAGTLLEQIPMPVLSFEDFAAAFPDATILSEDTGFARDYGINPYSGYDRAGSRPFLFTGKIDARLDGLERVLALDRDGQFFAAPYSRLADVRVAHVEFAGRNIVLFWAPGTVSALDQADIESSRDIGTAVPFSPEVEGRELSFTSPEPGVFVDTETSSTWSVAGLALQGPLAGTQLEPVAHTTSFWFAWAAFHPDTVVWEPA
ncbi:MAG: DUF3179 domain-containing protein [Dehalococcoidia bacterium]